MADAALDIPRMSTSDYLALERQSPCRHEFVDGVVYAMSGGSRRHNDITNDVLVALLSKLAGPCRPYSNDVKVHIHALSKEQFYYPNVVVTCRDLDNDDDVLRLPSLIVEVLSSSTEAADRGYKFEDYKKLPSLQEYVLVHQERACVEIYRRRTNWGQETFEPDAEITLESVDATVGVSAFYRRVRL